MNIDEECQAAMSRVSYAANANAEWEKIQMAKEFEKLREPKNATKSNLNEMYLRRMAAMQNCEAPYLGQLLYAQQAAFGSNPLTNFGMIGNFQW